MPLTWVACSTGRSTARSRTTLGLLLATAIIVAPGCSGDSSNATDPEGLLRGVTEIELGGSFGCARMEDSSVACWGSSSSRPWLVGVEGVRSMALMSQTSCAILESNEVRCVGYDLNGETAGDGLTDAEHLWAGGSRACVKRLDGTFWCWGADVEAAPFDLPSDVIEVALGANVACALRSGGKLLCWGSGTTGAFGESWSADTTAPAEVPDVAGVVSVLAAHQHICVLAADGEVSCAGYDFPAMLSPVAGLEPVVQMDGGGWGACAVVDEGRVQCWGRNMHGQLGDGTMNDSVTTAVTVEGIRDAMEVRVGFNFACALLADTTVRCWGRNGDGALGDDTMTDQASPVPVLGHWGRQ